MRFSKIWLGSWWRLGKLCEVPRCLLWRGLRYLSHVQCFLYLISSSINVFVFILHGWIPSGQTLYSCELPFLTTQEACLKQRCLCLCVHWRQEHETTREEIVQSLHDWGWNNVALGILSPMTNHLHRIRLLNHSALFPGSPGTARPLGAQSACSVEQGISEHATCGQKHDTWERFMTSGILLLLLFLRVNF